MYRQSARNKEVNLPCKISIVVITQRDTQQPLRLLSALLLFKLTQIYDLNRIKQWRPPTLTCSACLFSRFLELLSLNRPVSKNVTILRLNVPMGLTHNYRFVVRDLTGKERCTF